MRKLIAVLAMLCVGLFATSQVFAFTLVGVSGGETISFNFWNRDVGTLYQPGTYDMGTGDGVQNSWGIMTVSSITDSDNNPAWTFGGGQYLTGYFYGIDDIYAQIASNYSGFILSTGGVLELYLNDSNWNPEPFVSSYDASVPADPTPYNVVSGDPFLTAIFVPGIVSGDDVTTYFQGQFPTQPFSGYGNGYLMLTGGTHYDLFNSNAYDHIYSGADFYLSTNWNVVDLQQNPNSWPITSGGYATGGVIPEPTSMLLLGIGLLGAGVMKRKKG